MLERHRTPKHHLFGKIAILRQLKKNLKPNVMAKLEGS